ncbi:hypothetical protein G6M86_21030 [Agrobacterium tumefaciens]|uniref:Uncharacterized protein n=1 Tax=Agrobacterium tumefaciens TaxID=358 RepID=A0AAJ4N600_AGRTU|nr:hypothetical protein G6M86_21030 [Agrobacterium tumefaciens]
MNDQQRILNIAGGIIGILILWLVLGFELWLKIFLIIGAIIVAWYALKAALWIIKEFAKGTWQGFVDQDKEMRAKAAERKARKLAKNS